jgi:hypothetical protein
MRRGHIQVSPSKYVMGQRSVPTSRPASYVSVSLRYNKSNLFSESAVTSSSRIRRFTSDQETEWVIDTMGLASPRASPSHFDAQLMNIWQDAVLVALIIYIWSSNFYRSHLKQYETHCQDRSRRSRHIDCRFSYQTKGSVNYLHRVLCHNRFWQSRPITDDQAARNINYVCQ